MNELTKEEVLHVSDLAKINITDEELRSYQVSLKQILDEVNRINEINVDGDILISPSENENIYREDIGITDEVNVLKNAPKSSGNYIEIKRFVNE